MCPLQLGILFTSLAVLYLQQVAFFPAMLTHVIHLVVVSPFLLCTLLSALLTLVHFHKARPRPSLVARLYIQSGIYHLWTIGTLALVVCLALKLDGIIEWTWNSTFIPLWSLVALALLLGALLPPLLLAYKVVVHVCAHCDLSYASVCASLCLCVVREI